MQDSSELQQLRWAPLHMHSMGSLQDGISKPSDIAKCCKEYGYTAAALTDHGNLNQSIQFFIECRKQGIKPLLGIEFYLAEQSVKIKSQENKKLTHLVVIAKNHKGWKNLIRLVSESNKEENYYYKPRVDFDLLKHYLGDDDVIAINGHPGSNLGEELFFSSDVYRSKNIEDAKKYLYEDWEERAVRCIEKNIETFGINNFFVEIQLIDQENLPMSHVLASCLRKIVKNSNGRYRSVCTADSHYTRKEDCEIQRILLASNLGLTIPNIKSKIKKGEDVPLGTFFISNNYHIPTLEEMRALHTDEELSNAILISDMCEEYNILSKPKLPHFECPDGYNENDYLRKLCEDGWASKISGTPKDNEEYRNRLNFELNAILNSGTSGYFLITWDIVRYCKESGYMTGISRGSAGGSLVSYLTDITGMDPIPYKLLFERFISPGRLLTGELPDIDLDVPSEARESVIEYIKKKYGNDHVSQVATFGSLMGRSALKEVLKVEGEISFSEVNEITEYIPDEAQIADELELMEEKSIILWALQNRGNKLEKWVTLHDDMSLSGPLAGSFRRAIRLEGTYKSQGKHAAGIIISSEKLGDVCPMIRDRSGGLVVGLDMNAAKAVGQTKFDILGVNVLSKLMEILPYIPNKENLNNLDDPLVWGMLSKGDVKGVFQIEKQSRWVKKLKPENIHHLAALNAIIRPACCEAYEGDKNMTEHYIDRKNGIEKVPSIHPIVDEILKDTYNVNCFQETSMSLAKKIAGFDPTEADYLRKAIGSKNIKLMHECKEKFLSGSQRVNLVPREIYEKIFDWIEKGGRYGFNASHSYGYSITSYYTAFCKLYNPLKFYEVYLNHAKNKQNPIEEIKELVNDARAHGIHVYGPNLSNFHYEFTLNKEGNFITFGISNLKEVGSEGKKLMLVKEEMGDMFEKMTWMEVLKYLVFEYKVNKKAMKALMVCGALNGPNNKVSRNQMVYEYDIFKELTDKEASFIVNNLNKEKSLAWHMAELVNKSKISSNRLVKVIGHLKCVTEPPYSLADNGMSTSKYEREYMGISITNDELMGDIIGSLVTCTCEDIRSGSVRGQQSILGTITNVKEIKIKKENSKMFGQKMCFCSVQDSSGELNSVVVFPDLYKDQKPTLCVDNLVLFTGKVENRQGEYSLISERIMQA